MEKISTASDQYFLSYVKKTTGGVKLTPPPAGIGLNEYLWNEDDIANLLVMILTFLLSVWFEAGDVTVVADVD